MNGLWRDFISKRFSPLPLAKRCAAAPRLSKRGRVRPVLEDYLRSKSSKFSTQQARMKTSRKKRGKEQQVSIHDRIIVKVKPQRPKKASAYSCSKEAGLLATHRLYRTPESKPMMNSSYAWYLPRQSFSRKCNRSPSGSGLSYGLSERY